MRLTLKQYTTSDNRVFNPPIYVTDAFQSEPDNGCIYAFSYLANGGFYVN